MKLLLRPLPSGAGTRMYITGRRKIAPKNATKIASYKTAMSAWRWVFVALD